MNYSSMWFSHFLLQLPTRCSISFPLCFMQYYKAKHESFYCRTTSQRSQTITALHPGDGSHSKLCPVAAPRTLLKHSYIKLSQSQPCKAQPATQSCMVKFCGHCPHSSNMTHLQAAMQIQLKSKKETCFSGSSGKSGCTHCLPQVYTCRFNYNCFTPSLGTSAAQRDPEMC